MARKDIEMLDGPIRGSRRLKADRLHVVASEVRVQAGGALLVEDGATILIRNGILPSGSLRRAALIFDPGSRLEAGRLFLKACDDRFRQVRVADNGGLWFTGTFRSATKDGLSVAAKPGTPPSAFRAGLIAAYHLGHGDPAPGPARRRQDDRTQDDRDGFSLLGVGPQEWDVREVRSFHSGDDGIDLTQSQVALTRLRIVAPAEDGINLSSSTLRVARSLAVDVTANGVADRDIFDLETDHGPSYVEVARHCHVDIHGVFGDQLRLTSPDLPPPGRSTRKSYGFKGFLRKSPALVYSLMKD